MLHITGLSAKNTPGSLSGCSTTKAQLVNVSERQQLYARVSKRYAFNSKTGLEGAETEFEYSETLR